nr:uncharacterized protein LOC111421260 [Onthophagus taurus]
MIRSNIGNTYNILNALIFVGCFIYACEDVKILSDSSNNSISQATGLVDLYAGITTQTISIFLCCINGKRFIQLTHGLANIDKHLEVLGEIIEYKKSKKFVVWGLTIITTEFIITFSIDYALFIQDESKVYLITSYYPIITIGIVKLQLTVLMYFIKQRFQALNNIVKEISGSRCNIMHIKNHGIIRNNVHIIHVIHKVHNQLCQICSLVNYLYGIPLLMFRWSVDLETRFKNGFEPVLSLDKV